MAAEHSYLAEFTTPSGHIVRWARCRHYDQAVVRARVMREVFENRSGSICIWTNDAGTAPVCLLSYSNSGDGWHLDT